MWLSLQYRETEAEVLKRFTSSQLTHLRAYYRMAVLSLPPLNTGPEPMGKKILAWARAHGKAKGGE